MFIIIIYLSGWIAVERDVHIPWDLEGTPLQIKTDSALDSDEEIGVVMYDKDGSFISSFGVKFFSKTSTVRYYVSYCTSNMPDLPVQPPVEEDKIWTITKTETALIITCNGVEVLNYLFADSSDSKCVPAWGGDVEEIYFRLDDRASDFYRAPTMYQD